MAATTYRQIIVLDANLSGDPSALLLNIICAFWLVAPANRIVPLPAYVPRTPAAAGVISGQAGVSWGVTQAELTALQSGVIVEQVQVIPFDLTKNPTPSFADLEASATAKWTALQNVLNKTAAALAHLPGAYLAADGVTWTAGP